MLIVAGGTRADDIFAQDGIERVAMQFGEFVQERFGSCVGSEDAADRGQGEGAEANGAFQGGANVLASVVSDQRQQVLRLQLALNLLGEQAIEERRCHGTEFREALPQQPGSLLGIAGRMMALDHLPHSALGAGDEWMAGELVEAGRVDDHFVLGNADRQQLADIRSGNGVEVQTMRDEALDVDVAIDDECGVEVASGERQQVRPFAFVAVAWRLLEVA